MSEDSRGVTRRNFLKSMGAVGVGLGAMMTGVGIAALDPLTTSCASKPTSTPVLLPPPTSNPVPTLDPTTIPKYVTEMVVPPAMPVDATTKNYVQYKVAARQFSQQVLPSSLPQTTVWGYGSASGSQTAQAATNHWPGFTIETRTNTVNRVYWINNLVDSAGNYLPHLFYVDPTLHWANPPGPVDSHGMIEPEATPLPYTGPVPITTHLHGAHVPSISDGGPETWFLPSAKNIPDGHHARGSHYNSVQEAPNGQALYEYPNSQPATALWYHDHVLGMTRLNVHAGLAGFWLIRDDFEDSLNLPGPSPKVGDAPGMKYYEIPLAIQDRSFNSDGSIFFPSSRAFFEDWPPNAPYAPTSDVPPYWNPEYFGNTMVVNGNTWPRLEVERRLYRFRFLNGCNSRTLILSIIASDTLATTTPDTPIPDSEVAVPFNIIGSDGGLLPGSPVVVKKLIEAPAERWDVIVDFSSFAEGTELYLVNEGPDSPFTGVPYDDGITDTDTTGQVMKFVVTANTGQGNAGVIPTKLRNDSDFALSAPVATRDLVMRELDSHYLTLPDDSSPAPDTPAIVELGNMKDGPLSWGAPITENPGLGDSEVWRLVNFTVDGHPIHLHLVQFKVLDRTPIDSDKLFADMAAYIMGGKIGEPPDPSAYANGPVEPAKEWEKGFKDTAIVYPGYMTRIQTGKFDLSGLYVWHCHIIDHEDNEMMRPFYVGPIPSGSMP